MVSRGLRNTNFRYERKFIVSELTTCDVVSTVKLHPAMFSEIYHQRFVNNIYFDFVNLQNYFDNIDGNPHRTKIRVRWYGESFGTIRHPALELKSKHGSLGTKQSFSLPPFVLDNNFSIQTVSDIIKESSLPDILKLGLRSSFPTLFNVYSRRYFRSADGNYRITIDSDHVFYRIRHHNNSFINTFPDRCGIILELKYNQNMDDCSHYITNCFPFRLAKSSKYVGGIQKVYSW